MEFHKYSKQIETLPQRSTNTKEEHIVDVYHQVAQPCHLPLERSVIARDENGLDTNGYHSYYICFHISVRIRIRTRIAFGYIYEYRLTRLRIRIMSIEYGMNRIRRRSDTNIYSDIE